jgi:integrase
MAELDGDFGRFFRLLVLTGLRRGELMGLAWADILPGPELDGEPTRILNVVRAALEAGGVVSLGPTKSKRTRQVLIGAAAIAVLAEQAASVMAQTNRASCIQRAGVPRRRPRPARVDAASAGMGDGVVAQHPRRLRDDRRAVA